MIINKIYEPIKKGDTIGVTATSGGVEKQLDINRFNNAKKQLENEGYKVIFTPDVFSTDGKGRSTDKYSRAHELMELINNPLVKAIITAKGGEYLVEILEYLDYDVIKKNAKLIQGFSDTTGLIYSITTKCMIPTLYATNFGDYGMESWHQFIKDNYGMLRGYTNGKDEIGEYFEQHSYLMYENGWHNEDKVTGLEGVFEDEKVSYDCYDENGSYTIDEIKLNGILLGGCLDVLLDLAGTKYENTLEYIEKYNDTGILWHLESFSANSEAVFRGLWKLKTMGWFENANGFVFGRPLFTETFTDTTYEDSVKEILGDLGKKMVFNADLGHKNPKFTLINGAFAELTCKNHAGVLKTYMCK